MQRTTIMVIIWGESMKKFGCILICFFVLSSLLLAALILTGYLPTYHFTFHNHPTQQSNTVWQTADETMVFYVGDDRVDPVYCSVQTDEGTEELVFSMSGITTGVQILFADDWRTMDKTQPLDAFAFGHGTLRGKNKFVLEIVFADYIFEEGQRVVFHRVDEAKETPQRADKAKETPQEGCLMVNGYNVSDACVTIYPNYAEVPLIVVLTELGYQAEWEEGDVVTLTKADRVFTLDLQRKTIKLTGDPIKILFLSSDSENYYCQQIADDLLLDTDTLDSLMKLIKENVNISINYEEAIVTITSKTS